MRTTQAPIAAPEGELDRFIYDELVAAREDNRPVSRQMLARLLHGAKGISLKEAEAIVEEFCEARSPATPEYLGNEFLVPYLKLTALISSIAGVVLLGNSVNVLRNGGKPVWWWGIAAGVVLLGLAVLSWVKSLYGEHDPSLKIEAQSTAPQYAVINDPDSR